MIESARPAANHAKIKANDCHARWINPTRVFYSLSPLKRGEGQGEGFNNFLGVRLKKNWPPLPGPLLLWGGEGDQPAALGKDLRTVQAAAFAAVERIQFEGAHFRRDIAAKATK